jgi:hypothetical protein
MTRFAFVVTSTLIVLGASHVTAQTMPKYRVEADGFNCGAADIKAVCDSAGKHLWKHFEDFPSEPLVVKRGYSGPFFSHVKNKDGELVILLDTGNHLWSQFSYQFSHEFLHYLCGYKHKDRGNLWFEETLAETASLYCMRAMAKDWKENPPYSNWKEYRDSLRDYIDNVEKSRTYITNIHARGLPTFYAAHRKTLEGDPNNRPLNGAMALVLLRLFEAEPGRWEAVRWLNSPGGEKKHTFEEHLQSWKNSVPEKHKTFVQQVAELYGIELE